MPPEENKQDGTPPPKGEGEGKPAAEVVSLSKTEYEELVSLKATTGSLKRELKDAQKALEETKKPKETPDKNQPDNGLLQKAYLRSAGIVEQDEVELALATAKKWGLEVDLLVSDEDFKVKLEKLRTQKSNEKAVSGIQGGGGGSSGAKNTPEYWLAKGVPPSREEVPDRKTRAKISRAFMENARPKAGFYNE